MSAIGKVPRIDPLPELDSDLPEMLARSVSIDTNDPVHRMTEGGGDGMPITRLGPSYRSYEPNP